MKFSYTFAGLATALFSGCASLPVNMTAPAIKAASINFAKESDLELARQASPAQLKTADGFLVSSPTNELLLEVVAQGYIEYAFGFLEDDLDALPDDGKHDAERAALRARATELYDRAHQYALRLVDDRALSDALKKDAAATDAAAKRLGRAKAPGLFFAGLALASAINLNRSDVTRIVELPKAIALIKRAYELDPKFYNGGPAMTLGTLYAAQGKAMGGDPDAAKKYFDQAIAASDGKFLLTKVMMARFYAVITQDRPLFESTLKAVLAAPPDLYPDFRLANELAKRRAARFLAHAEDYF
jgi:hypothetical protein